ncbi:MAG: hypothetical protein LAP21_09520 [Acidobacteriia bacterium]|nr:hypothetical protein [Terriglobia bacterium]
MRVFVTEKEHALMRPDGTLFCFTRPAASGVFVHSGKGLGSRLAGSRDGAEHRLYGRDFRLRDSGLSARSSALLPIISALIFHPAFET